jgi:hypothetical protein
MTLALDGNCVEALRRVLDYVAHDEERDYECNPDPDHIYLPIRELIGLFGSDGVAPPGLMLELQRSVDEVDR